MNIGAKHRLYFHGDLVLSSKCIITIEAVGAEVTRFAVGDEVFGSANGAFAEYVAKRADKGLVLKPANLSFDEAAALPIAAVTALQARLDCGAMASAEA